MQNPIISIELVGECLEDLQVLVSYGNGSTRLLPVTLFAKVSVESDTTVNPHKCCLKVLEYYKDVDILTHSELKKLSAFVKKELGNNILHVCNLCK